MKHRILTITVFSLLFSSHSMGQEQKKSANRSSNNTSIEKMDQDFTKIDLDADGGITLVEMERMNKDYEDFDVQKMFKMFDKNSDGIINNAEFMANKEVLRKRPGRTIKK